MTDQLTLTQVEYGCEVTATGTPDTHAHVAAGGILVANVPVSVSAQTVTPTTADTTKDRIDAIVVNSSGTASVLAGSTSDDNNVQPPDTSGYALLAYVFVVSQASADYTGTITSGMIADQRDFALRHVSPYKVSGLWYGPAGNASSAVGWVNNDMWVIPYFVGKSFDVQAIGAAPKAGGTAGSKGRLGIYRDDGAGGLSLLVDAGQIALDVSTPGSLTITQTLTPGFWWFAIAFQSLGASIPSMETVILSSSMTPLGIDTLAHASTGYTGVLKVASVSAGLPSTVAATVAAASAFGVPGVWVQAT